MRNLRVKTKPQTTTARETDDIRSDWTHLKGILMILVGAVLWGVSGSAAQVLFNHFHVDPAWLVHIRMTASGLMLLIWTGWRQGIRHVFNVWFVKADALRLIILAVLGLLGVQYTYFVAISKSNAATATLLQYLAPVLIVLWFLFRTKTRPQAKHMVAVGLAVAGTGLLVTNGKWGALGISVAGIVWGILSAIALAFYTIAPPKLIGTYGSLPIVGWCMFIGGFVMGVFHPFWQTRGQLPWVSWYLVAFVVLFGTMVAFSLFTASLKSVTSQEASLLSCSEPLASALFAVFFLNLHLTLLGWMGGIFILAAVVLLSRQKERKANT